MRNKCRVWAVMPHAWIENKIFDQYQNEQMRYK